MILHIGTVKNKTDLINQAYDSPPLWYDLRGLCILWLTYKSSLRKQITFFSCFGGSQRHLEAAIGSGSLFRIIYFWSRIKRTTPNFIVGFDYAPSMLAGAVKIFGSYKNIHLEIADAANLPYQNETFDSVHLANAVHCIPDYPVALAEMFRVLKFSGLFRVNVLLPPEGFLESVSNRINQWGIKKGILQGPIRSEVFIQQLTDLGFNIIKNFKDGNCLYIEARKEASFEAPTKSEESHEF